MDIQTVMIRAAAARPGMTVKDLFIECARSQVQALPPQHSAIGTRAQLLLTGAYLVHRGPEPFLERGEVVLYPPLLCCLACEAYAVRPVASYALVNGYRLERNVPVILEEVPNEVHGHDTVLASRDRYRHSGTSRYLALGAHLPPDPGLHELNEVPPAEMPAAIPDERDSLLRAF